MATTHFSSELQRNRDEAAPITNWAMIIAAAALALLIGLSAVDIQRQRTMDADKAEKGGQGQSVLDGRGKWAGYM